jgi:hypothetical protein
MGALSPDHPNSKREARMLPSPPVGRSSTEGCFSLHLLFDQGKFRGQEWPWSLEGEADIENA